MAHGLNDQMVLAEWGEATFEALTGAGVKAEFMPRPGLGHELDKPELEALAGWILATLGR